MALPPGYTNWSFSVLDMFENCPHKYWAVRVAKTVKDDNQYNLDGTDEHESFALYLKRRIGLPPRAQKYKPMLDAVLAAKGDKYIEHEMTLDYEYQPCGWKDWDRGWLRVAADVLIVDGGLAVYLDWKTGKFYPKDDQLKLTSLMVFKQFPQVTEFRGSLVFHRQQKVHDLVITRHEETALWPRFLSTVQKIEQAKATGIFPKTPNGLCAYCPVKTCEHWKPNPRR